VLLGQRLDDWIIEKMDPNQMPWTASDRLGERTRSHVKAWTNPLRPAAERGRHFTLQNCLTWMRLYFWAIRECGLITHAPFLRWYIQSIEHFIVVYEREALPFVEPSAEWSANPANLIACTAAGCVMDDVQAIRERIMIQIIQQRTKWADVVSARCVLVIGSETFNNFVSHVINSRSS